jgi:hypothetical protein
VVTTDLLRERIANYTCDARGTATELSGQFPGVDFDEVSGRTCPAQPCSALVSPISANLR